MNFFDARLSKVNGKYAVSAGGITVELSDDKQERLNAKNVAEQDVTLGVRPDHIMLCADGIKGHVEVSELMGSSVHLHISTVDSKDVIVIVPTNGACGELPDGQRSQPDLRRQRRPRLQQGGWPQPRVVNSGYTKAPGRRPGAFSTPKISQRFAPPQRRESLKSVFFCGV